MPIPDLSLLSIERNDNKRENARRAAKKEIKRIGERPLSRFSTVKLVPRDVVISNRQPLPYDLANMSEGWNFAQSLDVVYDEIRSDLRMPLNEWGSPPWPEWNPQRGIYSYVRNAYDNNEVNLDYVDHVLAQKFQPEDVLQIGRFRQKSRRKSRKSRRKSRKSRRK